MANDRDNRAPQQAPSQAPAAPAPTPTGKVRVRAIARGYFGGQLREVGDAFEIEGASDLGSWMDVLLEDDRKRLIATIERLRARNPQQPAPGKVRPTPACKLV